MSAAATVYLPRDKADSVSEIFQQHGFTVTLQKRKPNKGYERTDVVCRKGKQKLSLGFSSKPQDGYVFVLILTPHKDKDVHLWVIDLLRAHGAIDGKTYQNRAGKA